MELIDKADILSQLWVSMSSHEPWTLFFRKYEDGLFLSYAIDNDLALSLSSAGETAIEVAYNALCDFMQVDSSMSFASLQDMFDYAVTKENA